ncbi:MAG: DUF1460 domain-containing protein [Bacteroidaceae bacterium]|nr:DUF1460 domain-containing protein [Bacteroidaceae bacterium]
MLLLALQTCGKTSGDIQTLSDEKPTAEAHIDYEIDDVYGDSTTICQWIKDAEGVAEADLPLFFVKKMLGRPYVAHTLEHNKREKLVINIRDLDCTTSTENVMALSICRKKNLTTFADFCDILMNLRYEKPFGGNDHEPRVAYSHRNHYFTGWANSNIAQGYFTEITQPAKIFSAHQRVKVDYMTAHPQYYKMLNETPTTADSITAMEQKLSNPNITYHYIPKANLKNTNTAEYRNAIHEGDIVVILTNKPGLDTQHITMAHWGDDKQLHIMHASSIHKKVVFEPKTLYQYLMNQKSAIGVRILRLR